MHRCLALAERGRGKVGTNPLVGAVLVRGEEILAEGWHEAFGQCHAERALLEDFTGDIRPDDVLYVNLEPCCHHGKTPPCAEIIIGRGVKRVVYGMIDPNVRIAGKGMGCLWKDGVEVIGPVERARCEWLNRGFVSLQTKGRPWVTVRMATTLRGVIAKSDGSPLKITSELQNRWTHEWLRARHDAILVGVQTVITDDPQLTTRLASVLPSPLRIVLDPQFRIPENATIVNGEFANGTLVIIGSQADQGKRKLLGERGVTVCEVPLQGQAFDLQGLWKVLTTPRDGFSGITSVLVEGGARTWQFFREAGCVDEEVTLMGS